MQLFCSSSIALKWNGLQHQFSKSPRPVDGRPEEITMDDLSFGTRDKRGDWSPSTKPEIAIAPILAWPPSTGKLVRWLIDYIWPWNAFHMATALAYWAFIIPDVETMKTLSWGWALWLYGV